MLIDTALRNGQKKKKKKEWSVEENTRIITSFH